MNVKPEPTNEQIDAALREAEASGYVRYVHDVWEITPLGRRRLKAAKGRPDA